MDRRSPMGDEAGLELVSTPTWIGDPVAARRFNSPDEVRAALLPEQVAEFDAAFDAASCDVPRVWRRQALLTERDPEGHRQMLAAAAAVTPTRAPRPGSVSWAELKADLGH